MNNPISTANYISIFPPWNLYRGLIYLGSEVAFEGPGFQLDTLGTNVVNIGSVYLFMVGQWVVIMSMWWYLEQVLPSSWGVKKHPLFMFGFGKHRSEVLSDSLETRRWVMSLFLTCSLPADVQAEKHRVLAKEKDENFSIQVQNIRKVYPAFGGNSSKVAVKGVSFGVEHNSCLGILGHNGKCQVKPAK